MHKIVFRAKSIIYLLLEFKVFKKVEFSFKSAPYHFIIF